MKISVVRKVFGDNVTIGEMFIDGTKECDTLEDAVRELSGKPVSSWKIAKHTAIPRGTYKVIVNMSNRFKKLMPLIENVPGFEGIRIHGGNTHEDTEGCILVGKATDQLVLRYGSREISQKICDLIKAAQDKGEKITLEIG